MLNYNEKNLMKRDRLKDSFNSSTYLMGLLEEYNFFVLQF